MVLRWMVSLLIFERALLMHWRHQRSIFCSNHGPTTFFIMEQADVQLKLWMSHRPEHYPKKKVVQHLAPDLDKLFQTDYPKSFSGRKCIFFKTDFDFRKAYFLLHHKMNPHFQIILSTKITKWDAPLTKDENHIWYVMPKELSNPHTKSKCCFLLTLIKHLMIYAMLVNVCEGI